MAKLALTLVGMGIGGMIGGPFGAKIGAMIGGMVGNMLFSPSIKGPRLADLSVTASTYGNIIPELYGTVRMSGNVIWSTGIKEHKHKSGGKGGPKQTTYTYSASYAVAFCKGAVDGCLRIWADGKLIAGTKPQDTANGQVLATSGILNLTKNNKGKFSYVFYLGDETQTPDATIVADKGDGNVPGYRGLCYIVFKNMPLEDFGNRIPQITAEISRNPVPATPYANLSSDTGFSAPDFSSSGNADWTSNQFYKYDSGYIIHYDLRTMAELYRVPVALVDGGAGTTLTFTPAFNFAFSVGGAYFFANTSLRNSGTAQIWDATTGAGLGNMGHQANSFPASVIPDPSFPFDPDKSLIGTFDARAMWFRVLGTTQQYDYVFHVGNLGSSFIIWTPARVPAYYGVVPFGAGASWAPMRGLETPPSDLALGNSDLLLINSQYSGVGVGWDVWVKRINFIEGVTMTFTDGPPYEAVNSALTTDVDIQLPRPFAGEDFRAVNWAFDQSDNSIVIWGDTGADNFGNGGTWRFAKYLIDENAYKWAWKDTDLDPSLGYVGIGGAVFTPAQAVGYPSNDASQSNLDGGTVGWMRGSSLHSGSAIYVADLTTGKVTISNLASPLGSFVDGNWAMNAWDDSTMSVMGAPTRVFVRAQGDGVSLQTIVDDVLTRTGALTPGLDWDSSALAGITVRGYTVSRESTAKDVLTQLASAYFYDGVESDYIIKFVLRGGNSVATFTEKYLSWVQDMDITVKETRVQELDMPMRVTISYSDFDRDYQQGTQSAKRNTNPFPTMHSHNEQKFELPIVMSATEAKQIADKSLKMAWASRWSYKLKLPWEFLKYDPSDVIDVVLNNGTTYEMRLDKIDLGVDFTLEVDSISEKPAAYTSVAVGDPGTGVPVQQINIGGPCDLYILNTPLLRDLDDTQGVASVYYAAAKAKSPGDFIACYIFEATDTTATEFADNDVLNVEPIYGTALSALPAHIGYHLDTTSVLTVRIMAVDSSFNPRTLSSCTMDELLAGANSAIVGDEVIQFMTAVPSSDGKTYTLTNLLRARRGTNYAVTTHVLGEKFIMLDDDGSIHKEMNGPSNWSLTHVFKPVPTGEFEENVVPISVQMQPTDLMPYSPECVKASDDGTNVTITFERRSRISNELHDADATVPYKEGQGSLAHFVYNVWGGKLLSDTPWSAGTTPTFTGQVAIYSGLSFANLTFNFAKAGITEFVVELYEVGFADGISKYVQFVNVPGTNQWDMTELY